MRSLRFGYFPDTEDHRDLSIHDSPILGIAPTVASDEIDFRPYLDAVQTQIGNSCVGHSIASAAFLNAAIAGAPIERPSPLFPYTMARLIPKLPRITDAGCAPRDAMLGIAAYGLVANDRWPEVEAYMNAVPPLDAFEAGDAARIAAYYRIPSGPGAASAARMALKRGRAIVFGMVVDQAWEDLGEGIYTQAGGAFLGGHAQVIIGWAPQLDAFLVLNSWGVGWGNEGCGWLSATAFERQALDAWVIDVTPPEVS